MGWWKDDVDSILNDFNKTIDRLDKHAEKQDAVIDHHEAQVSYHKGKSSAALRQQERAHAVSKKLKEIVQ